MSKISSMVRNLPPRAAKLLELMAGTDLNGLVIYSNGTQSILRPAYFHYFSHLRPLGRNNVVIISRTGEMAMLVEPVWDRGRAATTTWISDVRTSLDFNRDLAGIISEFKIKRSIGIAGMAEMPHETCSVFTGMLKIESADWMIEELAKQKTKEEIARVRRAARIADVGFKAFLQTVRVGMKEYELTAEIEYAMRMAGAEDNFILISSGKHNLNMHSPLEKRLARGDIIIVEITPVYQGQVIQLCRTAVLGSPDAVLVEKYQMLVASLQDSLGTVRPGRPSSVISAAMNKIISAGGYAKYCCPPYMRARGHGLGLGSVAPGAVIDDKNQTELETGQVLVIHPNQYFPETGYLACGETFMVTATGIERLAKTETRLYVKDE